MNCFRCIGSITKARASVQRSHPRRADIFLTTQKVGKVVEREYEGTSLTIVMQDGTAAGQTVPHCHVHIIPRRFGDWANNDDIYIDIDKTKLNKVYAAAESTTAMKVDNEERQPRTLDDMAKEADNLRRFFTSES